MFIKRTGHDLNRLGRVPLEIRHFLRTLIDQQHDDLHILVVRRDGGGDLLQQYGLARTRRGDDQTTLSLADQAQAVVEAIPTISGFWNEARKKRNTSTLRDHYDLISADPELTSDERDGLLSLRKIREAQLSTSTQKTLV